MKTVRIFSLIIAFLLTLTPSAVLAESIFPSLEEEPASAPALIAPSWGAMANAAEDLVEQGADGGTIVTYRSVDAAGFNRFGVYLGGRGFSVTGQDQQEDRLAYAVSDGQVSFVLIYSQAAQTLQLIYPKGTAYEKSAFPGYLPAEAGEEITVDGLGRFVFTDLVPEGNGFLCAYAGNYDGSVELYNEKGNSYWEWNLKRARSWLQFAYVNTAAAEKTFSQEGNDLFEAEVVYLENENEYAFPMKDIGRYILYKDACIISTGPDKTPDRYTLIHNPPCNPLDSMNGAAVFDLSEGVRSSGDGILAVRLVFKTGDRYVVFFRH